MNERVDVSVIAPALGQENRVVDSITSALRQGTVALEVLVIDSEGAARAGVEALNDSRVRYVHWPFTGQGRHATLRNEGAGLARGRFLIFLDDDDLLENDALSVLVRALEARPSAGMAFGAVVPFGDDERTLRQRQAHFRSAARVARRLRGRLQLSAQLLFKETVLTNSGCMTRRDVFAAAGGYDPAVPVREDVELWLRIARAAGFVYVDRPVVRRRTGGSSQANGAGHDDLRAAYARMHRKYREERGTGEFLALKLMARTLLR